MANNMVIEDAITLDQLRTFLAGLDGRFATPSDVRTYGLSISGHTVSLVEGGTGTSVTVPDSDTTYQSKAAASGGTDVSLVTTGEKAAWNAKTSNTGTVTKVSTGVGLTGGDVTTTGTIKAKLRSETALTRDSAAATETADRVYPVVPDKSGYLAVNVPWQNTAQNQNAFSNVKVGDVTVAADSATDTVELVAGTNVTITPDATNDKVTIAATDTNTKNTAGSTDSSSKLFLIGATSQAASPQTYSHDTAYVGTDGCLYSGGAKVLTSHQDVSGKADKSAAVSSITRSGTTFTATRADGTTFTFTQQDNNTWTALVGATSSANGTAGYAPQPPKDGYNTKYLRADGTWAVPPNTTYSALTNTEIDNAVAAAFA